MTNSSILLIIAVCFIVLFLLVKIEKMSKRIATMQKTIDSNRDEIRLLEAEKYKFQLQPHTLKNLFSQMKAFSYKLNVGMESLSSSLDYIFYKGKDHFVFIQDEIEFIEKYLKLNDLFLTEPFAIAFDFDRVDEDILLDSNFRIPHLITAYFLENAFKHGDLSHPEFLRVEIVANKNFFTLMVKNKIKQKAHVNRESGIGLENMKKRLDLFANGKYEIKNSCNETDYYSMLKINFVL